jgi:predicted O-methyltransferase YrrM
LDLRPKPHWTPRYIRDRLMLAYEQKRQPDAPWWPVEAIRHMDSLVRPLDTCLEWGSGRSTIWLSARTKQVISIEDNREWFDRVRGLLASAGTDPGAVRLLEADSTPPDQTPYVRVIDDFADGEIDVCVVDGLAPLRGHCAIAAIPKLAAGGVLLVDDAHWFLDRSTHAPHSRYGKGTFDETWRHFESLVSDWRHIWTTDGVTNTGIWLKPPASD